MKMTKIHHDDFFPSEDMLRQKRSLMEQGEPALSESRTESDQPRAESADALGSRKERLAAQIEGAKETSPLVAEAERIFQDQLLHNPDLTTDQYRPFVAKLDDVLEKVTTEEEIEAIAALQYRYNEQAIPFKEAIASSKVRGTINPRYQALADIWDTMGRHIHEAEVKKGLFVPRSER